MSDLLLFSICWRQEGGQVRRISPNLRRRCFSSTSRYLLADVSNAALDNLIGRKILAAETYKNFKIQVDVRRFEH